MLLLEHLPYMPEHNVRELYIQVEPTAPVRAMLRTQLVFFNIGKN